MRLSLVGIATRLQAGRLGFDSWQGKDCLFSIASIAALGLIEPRMYGCGVVVFPEVKRQGHESDHSLPSSAEVKNGGASLLRTSSWHSN
jgi:hypothetical protein